VDNLTKEFIAESVEGLERMERCLTELETRPEDAELLAEIFRIVHTIKGTTGFLGHGHVEMLAHAGENLLGDLRSGKLAVQPELISGLLRLKDGLGAMIRVIASGAGAAVPDTQLAGLMQQLRELTPAPDRTHRGETAMNGVSRPPPDPTHGGEAAINGAPNSAASETTLRVDVEVLNRMMNLVGELVLTRNQILQSTLNAENFPDLARRLDSVTAELRETVMQARMQPVGNLFDKFPRLVRDLAKSCGRAVRVEFEGAETGLDKSLLEAIKDPLTHAVRNSVDHGIEPPVDRIKAGKPVQGVVRLRAYQRNGSVVIEVSDDGAGIPRARVLAKAVERGLVTAERAAEMSDREILQLIFVAGFSTAAAVTHVSGRGVGMDVVRSNVEKAGGSVEVESREGFGTTLRMRLPLTLAIIPALVVRSGGQSFALSQSSLVELVYIPRRDAMRVVERIGTAELYRLRGRLLPLVWLDRMLRLDRIVGAQVNIHGFYIAVLEAEGCRFGLVVDDLLVPEEIVVKPISRTLREIGVFSGATVLGNGLLAMILDIAAIAARAGVEPVEEISADTPKPGLPPLASGDSMVIFENDRGQRTAMPLSAVERIVCVPINEIEYASGRPVLQFGGELLRLLDEGALLNEDPERSNTGAAPAADPGAERGMVTVLVCVRPGASDPQRLGVVVRRVLDIAAGTMLAADAVGFSGQLAMVKNQVTTVHGEFAGSLTRERGTGVAA
jgi:two-component system chemotaxis sensor kinase CheA